MDAEDFSRNIEDAFKKALSESDKIIAQAEAIRKQAEEELNAAKLIHEKAAQDADGLTEKYFEGRRDQLMEAARTEYLRSLVHRHLEEGKNESDIAEWLGLPLVFVEEIQQVLNRINKMGMKNRTSLSGNPKLEYDNKGRGGTVLFVNDQTRFDMWWEFAGGEAVAFVNIPNEEKWETYTRLPLSEREATLTFIGEQIISDQFSGNGSYIISEDFITFYKSA